MNLCLLAGAKQITLATAAFTLAWTHSVEKTRWEEDWVVTGQGLQIVEARIEGSGAGMEPPADAVRDGAMWRYHPHLPTLPELALARSGATGGRWSICFAGTCQDVPEPQGEAESAVVLKPCL